MEMEAGGEIGGEWMSAAHGLEPDSFSVGMLGALFRMYVTASATWTELTSDELLIAAS
jgi:hypothetical protein